MLGDNDSGFCRFAARKLHGDGMACITKQLLAFAQYDGADEQVETAAMGFASDKRWIERRTPHNAMSEPSTAVTFFSSSTLRSLWLLPNRVFDCQG